MKIGEGDEQVFVEAIREAQNLQFANNKLPALFSKYAGIFTKNKYDDRRNKYGTPKNLLNISPLNFS